MIEWDQSLRDAVGTRNHGDFPRSVKLRTHNQTGMESPPSETYVLYKLPNFVKSSMLYKSRTHACVRLSWGFAPEGFIARFFLDIECDDLPEQGIIDRLPPFYAEQLLAVIVAGVRNILGKP